MLLTLKSDPLLLGGDLLDIVVNGRLSKQEFESNLEIKQVTAKMDSSRDNRCRTTLSVYAPTSKEHKSFVVYQTRALFCTHETRGN